MIRKANRSDLADLLTIPLGFEDDITQSIIRDYLDDRCLIINQGVDDSLLEYVCMSILEWNREDKDLPADKRKKIYMFINSVGGECGMGLQVVNSITTSITPVVTIGMSMCASMASYILAAGHERYCFAHTITLLHDGQTGYVASANKGKDIQKYYNELDERIHNLMLKLTKMTPEFLTSIQDKEYYVWPEEAKELGIVDKIIGQDCTLDDVFSRLVKTD